MSLLSKTLFGSVLFCLFTTISMSADKIEGQIRDTKQQYIDVVGQSGRMSEAANSLREEIIDHYFDYRAWPKMLPYLRDTWAWYEEQDIKGKRKGRIRFLLGKSLRVVGNYEESQPLLEAACNKATEKKGERHRVTIKRCIEYGINISSLGKHDEALSLLKKYLEFTEVEFGENHGRTAYTYMQLGSAYFRAGEYKLARKHLKVAIGLFNSKGGNAFRLLQIARMKLGKLFRAMGKLDKSERVLRKGYVEFASKKRHQNHPLSLGMMTLLGRTLKEQGRYVEAEQLVKEGVERKKIALGATSHKTIQTQLTLIGIYLDQNKYKQAEAVLKDIARVEHGIKDTSRIGSRLNNLTGQVMLQLGKLDTAEQAYAKVKIYLDASSERTGKTRDYYQGLGLVYFNKGDYKAAEPLLLEAVKISELLHGKFNPKTSKTKSYLAKNYVWQRNYTKAITVYREVMESNAGFLANRKTFSTIGRAQQESASQRYLFSYMELIVNAYKKGIKIDAEPVTESFAIAENSRSKTLQTAMLGQTARAAARNEYLSDLVRKEQDLRVQLGLIEEQQLDFVKQVGRGDRKQGKRLEGLRKEALRELKKIGEEMSYQYPEYNRLINPSATELSEVQKLLVPGELMLAYYVQKENTLIWAIDSEKATLHVSKLAEKDIYARVQRIRAGLDVAIATVEDIPAYNLRLAHELYNELIAPVGKQLEGVSNLIIVPHKALLSMPFSALVMAKTELKKAGTPFSEYKVVPWLANKFAINIMPSATALVTMRTYAKKEKAEEPFIGFGDPLFGEDDGVIDVVKTRGIRVAQRAAFNTRSLNGLPNLPETREELEKIALSLGASADNIYLGSKASEQNVKDANLKNFRVVAFATHGLVADDLDGLEQPALALTPPDQADEENDGLLTMGEVLELDLNADWVVLSACNTASGDKSLANEGLTGLTQAFFYAGSRALLVSLWPVESTSTQELTTTMFSAAIKDKTLGRAASLQAARKRLIDGAGYMRNGKELFSYAHPIFWAAFIAVGEGGLN
ncbi:MAG: CHAT domain-containing protein [Sulfuriflexus sp.]|nr:CHAT domain-containing protein [Sulfuriflexus sp.]